MSSHVDVQTSTFNTISSSHCQINNVAGDQHNHYVVQAEAAALHRPLTFNDAPTGLLSPHFSGRELALKSIFHSFHASDISAPRRCAIYGMPGLGKTQLAIRCAQMAYLECEYALVFWMSGSSIEKLLQGFSRVLDLIDHPDRHLPSQSAVLTAAQRWLEESDVHEISWLLVVDNANQETVQFLRQHLPRKNPMGAILFTTRTHAVASALVQAERQLLLELKPPELTVATDIFLKEANSEISTESSDYKVIQEVVKSFGCLPLAISHAASISKQLHLCAQEILELCVGADRFELISWENDLTAYEEKSVAATFARQLIELEKKSLDYSNFLKVISFFDPEAISLPMLLDGVKELLHPQLARASFICPTDPSSSTSILQHKDGENLLNDSTLMNAEVQSLFALISAPMRRHNAIQSLQSLSLVSYDAQTGGSVLRIHDLVRETIRGTLKRENLDRHWFDIAIEVICGAFRDIPDHASPTCWIRCEMLAPHIQEMTSWDGEYAFQNTRFVRATIGMSTYLLSRGRFADAEILAVRAMAAMENLRGPDHPATLQAMHNVGTIYRFQGNYTEALPLLETALRGREEKHGTEHSATLTTMIGLADLYIYQARYAEAEALLKRALEGKEKMFGPEASETLAVVNDFAIAKALQGHYDVAEAMFRRALVGYEQICGADSAACLSILDGLARVLSGQPGRFREAEEFHARALAGKEKLLGATHPDTLRSINNLSEIALAKEDYHEAEKLSLKVLMGGEKTLAPDHPMILTAAKCLATIYVAQNRDNEAEPYLRRALAGELKRFGSGHSNTSYTLGLLIAVLEKQGKMTEAANLRN